MMGSLEKQLATFIGALPIYTWDLGKSSALHSVIHSGGQSIIYLISECVLELSDEDTVMDTTYRVPSWSLSYNDEEDCN